MTIGHEAATGFNPPDNLVANGSFERPVLERTWGTFVSDQIPGWKIISTGKIMAEVQRVGLSNWVASEGTQWLELDGDETGSGVGWNKKTKGRAEQGLYTIQQDVSSLIPGQNYWLSFDFAARPGTKLVDNHLRSSVVDADGNTLDDGGGEILASTQQLAPKKQPPRWKTATELFVAPASGQVTIQFTGLGNDNTLGMFLDNVVVVPFDADLDIDSDNDNRLGQPEKDDHEEDLETKQGKKIVVNSNDTDDDKIPDYADGFAIPRPPTGIAGKGFTPLVVKVPENVPLGMLELTLSYDAFSDPTQVGSGPEFSLPEDAGLIRIWRKNASEGRDP